MCVYGRSKITFFRSLELGGDFYKDTHEPTLFGMHIGSVVSGFHAGNVNTDAKISTVGFGDVWRGVKK